MKTDPESSDVLVFVEKDGAERFKIRSDQLDHIGEKLRGFSIFNSIILPLIVSAATVFFTGLFQYISWTNSVRLQEATEIANRAMSVSEKVTTAINQRRYVTFTFLDPLRELVLAKRNDENPDDSLSQPDATVGASASQASPKPLIASSSRQAVLSALDLDLGKDRFEAYYERLKSWNDSIGQLVTDVDYALDRPIFMRADGAPPGGHEGIGDYWELKDINCLASLPDELARKGFKADHLKMRLVGIHYCFMQLNKLLAQKKTAKGSEASWDKAFHEDLQKRLNFIDHMGNEFRCYALHRVDYYGGLKEQSIISPSSVWNRFSDGDRVSAERHFDEAASHCDPQKRRAAVRQHDARAVR